MRVFGAGAGRPTMKWTDPGLLNPRNKAKNLREGLIEGSEAGMTSSSPPTFTTPDSESNYELFNSNNVNIRYWSWNYRGCWHQTCPPIVNHKLIWIQVIAIPTPTRGVGLLFLVAASPRVSALGNLRACCLPWNW